MRLQLASLSLLAPLTASNLIPSPPQHIFSNPSCSSAQKNLQIPTSRESAILARRILHLTPLGTLSTIFPSQSSSNDRENNPSTNDRNRPNDLAGIPIGLTDYISDCEASGNPTILEISIATSFRNVAAGSNISLSLQWTPPYLPKSRIESKASSAFSWFSNFFFEGDGDEEPDEEGALPYSAANLPRFSLLGYLEKIPEEEVVSQGVQECFVAKHKDSKYWLPGNRIHHSEWTRLVVEQVYWVGGFGDRAYIGWIPVEEWRSVTEAEWRDVLLPGEKKGWKEWSFGWSEL